MKETFCHAAERIVVMIGAGHRAERTVGMTETGEGMKIEMYMKTIEVITAGTTVDIIVAAIAEITVQKDGQTKNTIAIMEVNGSLKEMENILEGTVPKITTICLTDILTIQAKEEAAEIIVEIGKKNYLNKKRIGERRHDD